MSRKGGYISDELYLHWRTAFKAFLDGLGIKPSYIADKCGVTRQAVNNWMSNGHLTVIQFRASMHVMDEILNGKDTLEGNVNPYLFQTVLVIYQELIDFYNEHGL